MALSGAARFIVTLSDATRAVESLNKLFTPAPQGAGGQGEDERMLQTASVINSLVLLGFTIAEVACLASGVKAEKLAGLKALESIPRVADIPIQFSRMSLESDRTLQGRVKVITHGLAIPIANCVRTFGEGTWYEEKKYLDAYKQDPNAQRPVYDISDESVSIIGYRPIDPEECRRAMETASQVATVSVGVSTVASSGVVSTAAELTKTVYEILRDYVATFRPEAAAQGLVGLGRIPEPLFNDELFRQHICPITLQPIRDPVRDPTTEGDAIIIYERAAITRWLEVRHQSPVTRRALGVQDLQEMPALRLLIENRLRWHQAQMDAGGV